MVSRQSKDCQRIITGWPWTPRKEKYSVVGADSEEDASLIREANGSPVATWVGEPRLWSRFVHLFPWLSSLILACVCLYLLLLVRHQHQSFSSVHWSINEFGPAKRHIAPLEISFTGGVSFNDKGEMYVPHPGRDHYVGAGPEIDKEWDVLTFGRYFMISEDEARATFGVGYKELYIPRFGGYVVGLDMFHTLHCLNNLRKLIHPEHYPKSDDPRAKMHDSHCIDQLRQQVMCAGDATPVPVKWHAAVQRSYVDSDVQHTCRNFRQLKNFTLDRFYRSDARVQDMLIHD